MDHKEVVQIAQQLHQSFVDLIAGLDEFNLTKRRKQVAELSRPWDQLGEAQKRTFLDLAGRTYGTSIPPSRKTQPRKQKANRDSVR